MTNTNENSTATATETTESVKFDKGLLTFSRATGSLKKGDYRVEARYSIKTNAKNLSDLLGQVVDATRDATIPGPVRIALVKHLTTTSLPVFFRARIKDGGEYTSLRNALAGCSGEAPVSQKCGQVRGLITAFGEKPNDTMKPILDAALAAIGVTFDEYNLVAKGKDPWDTDNE